MNVLRKLASNASNANAVYRQSTRYSCFTEEGWASVGLEFGVQWVGVFTATWQSVNYNQKPDVYFTNGHVKYGFYMLVSAFHIGVWWVGWVLVLASWVGLGEEKWTHVHLWVSSANQGWRMFFRGPMTSSAGSRMTEPEHSDSHWLATRRQQVWLMGLSSETSPAIQME